MLVLLLVLHLCQLPNGHMARRACIQALNEQPQNASRQVESGEGEKRRRRRRRKGGHCADAMNSWRRGEFFKIATAHTRARHEQPTLLLLHSSCCCLPHAACLGSCLAINALVSASAAAADVAGALPLVIVVNYLCISKFIWNTKANALFCSALLSAALPWPGISFHGISNVVFSRIAHLFVAVCWFYVLFFLLHLPQMGAQSGARACALRPHMVTLIYPQPHLSLSLVHTSSHFLGRAANNLCVFPWVWFIFPSAFQQLKQSAFLRAEAPRDVVVAVVVVQCSIFNVKCWMLIRERLLDARYSRRVVQVYSPLPPPLHHPEALHNFCLLWRRAWGVSIEPIHPLYG